MISEWPVITGIVAIACLLLSMFCVERYKRPLQQGALWSGLLCGAFLIGPPIDRAAGAFAVFLGCCWLVKLYVTGRI